MKKFGAIVALAWFAAIAGIAQPAAQEGTPPAGGGAEATHQAAPGTDAHDRPAAPAGAAGAGEPVRRPDAGTGTARFEEQPAFSRALADAAATTPGAARRREPDLPVTGFFVSAGVVLLALFGGLTLLRRLGRSRGWIAGSDAVQVLARKALGPHQTIVLVEVGSRILQVGLTKDSMVHLGEVTDPEEVARLKGKCASNRADSSVASFQKSLQESATDLEGAGKETERPVSPQIRDVKRELASIRNAVQGWASLARLRDRDGGDLIDRQ